MKAEVSRNLLVKGLAAISAAIAGDKSFPAMGNIKLAFSKAGGLLLEACDGNKLTLRAQVLATVKGKPWKAVVPGKRLLKIARTMRGSSLKVSFVKASDKTRVDVFRLESGGDQVSIEETGEYPAGAYVPEPPAYKDAPISWEGGKKLLLGMVAQVAPNASIDANRPILNTVKLDAGGDSTGLRLVASDGNRLLSREVGELTGDAGHALIDGPTLVRACKALKADTAEDVLITGAGLSVKMECGAIEALVRCTEGTFPRYNNLLAKGKRVAMRVDRQEALDAIAQLIAADDGEANVPRAVLRASEGEAVLRHFDGMSRATMPCEGVGTPQSMGVNLEFVQALLAGFDSDQVELSFLAEGKKIEIEKAGIRLWAPEAPEQWGLLMPLSVDEAVPAK